MACTDCSSGFFPNDDFAWLLAGSAPVTLPNGTTITGTGASSLVVSKGGASQIFNAPSGGQVHYYQWGTPANYLAILTVAGSIPGDRTLTVIDTESAGLTTHFLFTTSGTSTTGLTVLNHCPGSGGAFMSKTPDTFGGSVIASMWTSDTGEGLCSTGYFTQVGEVVGRATDTELQILHGSGVAASCDKPLPNCKVTPLTSGRVVFPEAVTGAGVDPALGTVTKQVTITNSGNNCLHVNSIGSSAHFSPVPGSESKPFPVTLGPGQNFHFDVRFSAAGVAVGVNIDEDLPIVPTPAATDTAVRCRGKARAPHRTITFGNLSFGPIPLGGSRTLPLQIHNTGEVPVTVNIPAPPGGIAYGWTPPVGAAAVIAVGATLSMGVTYTPTAEGPDNRTLTFTSDATGSPHSVSLTGSGCVARPVIFLPDTGPVVMNNVQQGFRTVRFFKVRNTGNGGLLFSARIVPAVPGDPESVADAAQFGLLRDNTVPVTDPPPFFDGQAVAPVTICGTGGTGSGEFLFGLAFFAAGMPRTVNARLEIFNHNDTGSGAPASFFVTLTATVTNAVSVDVELVLDRSGSMADASGSRTKIETARDAAKLFVALSRVDVGDRIGLVRFDTVPEPVPVNGSGIQEITAANHADIGNAISPANFSPGAATCISGGVMVAQKDIATHPRTVPPAALNKVMIVLTDGIDNVPYVNPDDGTTYSLLGGNLFGTDTMALPVPADIKIYAIGIGDDIDVGRLGTLATSTGGSFLHAREFSGTDYFNLEKHFTQVYMEAVNYAAIFDPVFSIQPGETQQFEFEVLNGDKSAMVVIYDKDGLRIPFYIQSPTGEHVDLLSVPAGYQIRSGISPTARFIEINMPQGEPGRYAGTWKVVLKHDRRACFSREIRPGKTVAALPTQSAFGPGFQPTECKDHYEEPILYGIAIGVGSNFNMVPFVTPGIVHTGEPIQLTAMVSEFGLPVKGCTVTVTARKPDGTASTHILKDDGLHGDDQPDDGTYGLAYIHTTASGTYTFTFTCTGYARDGKPVRREAVRSKYVEGHEPLVPISSTTTVGTRPDGKEDACCRATHLLLRILVVLGVIGIILLVLLLRKM